MSTSSSQAKWKVAIIGSGNWGSAVARIIGMNTEAQPELFDKEVRMWTYEEEYEGRKLTELFNEKHENVKYLPGVRIPDGVVAHPDLVESVKDANALVFVVPHQFIPNVCKQLKGKIPSDARAISLVKGVEVHTSHIRLFSDVIADELGIPCSALSGANIADEVARDRFSETTIGCKDDEDREKWRKLFHTEHFRVQVCDDVGGVSLCGALKNVVAVAAGFVDGLGWGNNSKAAIMRIGLMEMKNFSTAFFPDVKPETFLEESAGVADLITSCLGGRNRKVAEAFVGANTDGKHKTMEELEEEMLKGQKLQGVQTAKEVHEFLKARGKVEDFPLFTVVYRIAYEGVKPHTITAHI
ncbi:glycerol-3-phosphate dehydrogenase (NAD+) [Pseudohyphozyma bogoriensis]|nr:glycerol-3-phosphate dehydrogenase (NAD+) [Pseudohyphozyma bogoriensis]